MYHGVEMARAIVVGTDPAVTPWISVTYLSAWIVAGILIALRPMRKRLKP
jgi:ABC-type polysaccharide/polyol phosphate export permease